MRALFKLKSYYVVPGKECVTFVPQNAFHWKIPWVVRCLPYNGGLWRVIVHIWRFLVICLFLFLFMLGNPLLWKEMKTTYVLQVEGMRKTALLIYTVYLHPTTFTVIRVLRSGLFWIGPLLTFCGGSRNLLCLHCKFVPLYINTQSWIFGWFVSA